jgi:hypothetical protein
MSDVNWYGEDKSESVVINAVSAVAVYTNTADDIVIRQEGVNGEDDSVVIIPKMFVSALLKAINRQLEVE